MKHIAHFCGPLLAIALTGVAPAQELTPDAVLRALADPHRRAILRLVQHDELPAGQIAANFAQIFVISHNLMFERSAFTHHLMLADGQVVEHDFDRVL